MIVFKNRIKVYDLAGDALNRQLGQDGRVTYSKEDGEVINVRISEAKEIDLGFSKETLEIIKED